MAYEVELMALIREYGERMQGAGYLLGRIERSVESLSMLKQMMPAQPEPAAQEPVTAAGLTSKGKPRKNRGKGAWTDVTAKIERAVANLGGKATIDQIAQAVGIDRGLIPRLAQDLRRHGKMKPTSAHGIYELTEVG